jgi:hypothetical protein
VLASPRKDANVLPKLGTYQGKLWNNANCSVFTEQISALEGCTVQSVLKIPSSYTRNFHLSVHDGRFHEVTLKVRKMPIFDEPDFHGPRKAAKTDSQPIKDGSIESLLRRT